MYKYRPHHVWVVFWVCCAWYVLTASGHTYSPDEETMYAVTRAIVHTGHVNIVTDGSEALAALRPSPIGAVAPYGILPSLLAIPFYIIGLLAAPTPAAIWDTTHLLIALCNAPISAGCVAIFWRLLHRLRIPTPAITILTLTYAIGSLTWPYARTFFSEPLTTLLVLCSIDAARAAHTNPPRALNIMFVSGLMAGLLLPTRIAASTMIPIIGLYAIWGMPHQRFRASVHWLIGCVPGGLLFAGYNFIRFHTIFSTGYSSEITAFVTPWRIGIPGLLIDPFTGLVWFVPMLILAPFGAWFLWAHHRHIVVVSSTLIISQVLFYAGWNAWDGGGVWGPRFLIPIVPFGLMLCAGLWLRSHAMAKGLAMPILAASIVINILACAVNFNIDSNLPLPRTPPILAHAHIAWHRWYMAAIPANTCVLGAGWFPSEAQDGYLEQRSGAHATITCRTQALTHLIITLDDRRPANAPDSAMAISIHGAAVMPLPTQQIRTVHVLAPQTVTTLQITNQPWNPVRIGSSDRNDDLGPAVIDIQAHPALSAVYNAAIAPMPEQPKRRWAWHYDPTNQHVLDWWGWYLPFTTLAPWYTAIWIICIGLVGLMCGCAVWVWRRTTAGDTA